MDEKSFELQLRKQEELCGEVAITNHHPSRLLQSSIHYDIVSSINGVLKETGHKNGMILPLINIIEGYLSSAENVDGKVIPHNNTTICYNRDEIERFGNTNEFGIGIVKDEKFNLKKFNLKKTEILTVFEKLSALVIKKMKEDNKPRLGSIDTYVATSAKDFASVQKLATQVVIMCQEFYSTYKHLMSPAFMPRYGYTPMYGDSIFMRLQRTSNSTFYYLEVFWNGLTVCRKEDLFLLDFPSLLWHNDHASWQTIENVETKSDVDTDVDASHTTTSTSAMLTLSPVCRYHMNDQTVDPAQQGFEAQLLDDKKISWSEHLTQQSYSYDSETGKTKKLKPVTFTPLKLWRLTRKDGYQCSELSSSFSSSGNVADVFYLVTVGQRTTSSSSLPAMQISHFMDSDILYHLYTMPAYSKKLPLIEMGERFNREVIGGQLSTQLFDLMKQFKINPHRLMIERKNF
jgi:hypothetical protein